MLSTLYKTYFSDTVVAAKVPCNKKEGVMEWTADRTEELKHLWKEGVGVREIAARLGGFGHCKDGGRNAIIGKVHRLNLESRETAACRSAQSRETAARSTKHEPALPCLSPYGASKKRVYKNGGKRDKKVTLSKTPANKLPAEEPTPDKDMTVLSLSYKTCKWPIGDPGDKDFCFCGATPRDRSPYCEHHARMAYQPLQLRSRKT